MVFDGDEDCEVSSMFNSFKGLSLFNIPENVSVVNDTETRNYLMAQSSLMHFSAKCSGVHTDILIDSGATREYVDKSWCTKHGFHLTPLNESFSVALANGVKTVCSQYIKNVKCKFKQFSHVCDLYVLDLSGEHTVIFGQSFLRKRNPDIDWREQTMTLRKRHKKDSGSGSDSIEYVDSITIMESTDKPKLEGPISDKAKAMKESVAEFDNEVLSIMNCAKDTDSKERLDKLISEHHERYSELYDEDFLDYRRFRKQFRRQQKRDRLGKKSDSVSGVIWLSFNETRDTLSLSCDSQGSGKVEFTLSQRERDALEKSLREKHRDVFKAFPPSGVPPVRFAGAEMRIEDGDPSKPPASKVIRLNESQLFELRLQLQYYLEQGYIRPSDSAYATPVFFVAKPHTQPVKWRMACDYRLLNAITRRDQYPLPAVDQLVDVLKGAKVFSKMDLSQYFHQIPVHKDSIHKTAITTRYGNFEWLVVPFGIHNAPAIAQRVANVIFHDFLDHFVVIFMDDVLIFSKDMESHQKHIDMVLNRMREHQLYAHPEKCEFFKTEIEYL